jgi:rRNA-processing protein FCF1
MEIVVNDTQVLIDMYDADLLGLIERCSIKFHTVDYVMAELHRSPYKRPEIDQMVKDGILAVHSFSDKENFDLVAYYGKMARQTNLSLTDCAVLKYSKDNGYRLLTGDKKLRNHAEDEGVLVSGILYLVDKFVAEQLITSTVMAERLELLLKTNPRLPKTIFEERIKSLRGL